MLLSKEGVETRQRLWMGGSWNMLSKEGWPRHQALGQMLSPPAFQPWPQTKICCLPKGCLLTWVEGLR